MDAGELNKLAGKIAAEFDTNYLHVILGLVVVDEAIAELEKELALLTKNEREGALEATLKIGMYMVEREIMRMELQDKIMDYMERSNEDADE